MDGELKVERGDSDNLRWSCCICAISMMRVYHQGCEGMVEGVLKGTPFTRNAQVYSELQVKWNERNENSKKLL